MISRPWRGAALGGLLASAAVLCGPALAQQAEGTRSTLTLGFGVESGRNLDLNPGSKDNSTRLTGTLGYNYVMQSRQTLLSFDAALAPETGDSGDGTYPSAGVKWQYEGARTRLNFDARYSEAKVTDQNLGFDEDTGAIIVYDGTGTRVMKRVSAGIEGGVDMPLGYTLQVDTSAVDYRGTSSYSDSTSTGIKGGLRADVSAMTRLNLDLSHRLYESDNLDQTRRTTDRATFGVTQRIDALTSVTASIGDERVETRRVTQDTEIESGAIYGLGVTRADQLGSYGLRYDQSITENGAREALVASRDRETQFGKFAGTLGLSKGDTGGSDWIGSLTYATQLPRDTLSARFSRGVSTDDDGEDVVVTRLAGNIRHSLSEVNALNFGLVASATEYPDRDRTRLDATVSYQHLLTQDVSLQAGVQLRLAQDTDREDAKSQSVFLNLTRTFDFLQ